MDNKLDKINENLTGFFSDLVRFVKKVWEYIEKFFAKDATNPLLNEDESEAE